LTSLDLDPCFSVASSNIVFGPGATREVGDHAADLDLRRVLVVTDRALAGSEPVETAIASIREAGIDVELFAEAEVEPTDASFRAAAEVAAAGRFDGYVAVGGGSSMDTAKAANLYASYPADFLAYVNAPIGRAEPPPGPLRPLICIPTTAGTGSETTGVAIFPWSRSPRSRPRAAPGPRDPRRVRRTRARTPSATSGPSRRSGWSPGRCRARSRMAMTWRRARR
jgi:hydroxyacid-oxoacid transhydrogenase